jgi:hypothetical protein
MGHKKELWSTTRATVKDEMTKPRMTRSAKIAELRLDKDRMPENPSITTSGIVNKIIASSRLGPSEKAQIVVDGPDKQY